MRGCRDLSSLTVTSSPTLLPAPAGVAAAHNKLVCPLVAACAVPEGGLAPGRLRLATNRRTALAAAVRVVYRVHDRAAHVRALAQIAGASGLTDAHVLMVEIAHLPDGRHTADMDQALLARGQAYLRIVSGLSHKLRRTTCATHHLAAAARVELDVVQGGARWNVAERQCVAHADLRLRATHHQIPNLEAVWCQDVALLAIHIVQEGNTRRTVGIVLD